MIVDRTYVLNLDRRPEKWERSRDLLRGVGLDPRRFSAVDGQAAWLDGAFAASKLPHRGQLGCLLSHIAILHDAEHNGYDRIAVFEDDILPLKGLQWAALDKMADWRFVYLGAVQPRWDGVEFGDGFYRPHRTLGTWAMLIDRRYFAKLLHAYETTATTADDCLTELLHDDPQAYVIWPYLFLSDLGISDIRPWRSAEQNYDRWRWNPACYESPRSSIASG